MTARSPRGLLTVAVLPFLLLAAACRDEPKIILKAETGTGADAGSGMVQTAAEGQSLAVPADLPAFAPAYPGARLSTRIAGEGAGEGKGALFVFQTEDPVDKVSAFYDARAREAGAKASMEVTEVDSSVRVYSGGPDGKSGGAMVAISRSEDRPGTEIVITAGMPKADMVKLEEKPDDWRRAVRMPVRLQ